MPVVIERLTTRQWETMVNQTCRRLFGISITQFRKLADMGAFAWDGDAHCDLMKIEMLDYMHRTKP